jgi:hypothetical protein
MTPAVMGPRSLAEGRSLGAAPLWWPQVSAAAPIRPLREPAPRRRAVPPAGWARRERAAIGRHQALAHPSILSAAQTTLAFAPALDQGRRQ